MADCLSLLRCCPGNVWYLFPILDVVLVIFYDSVTILVDLVVIVRDRRQRFRFARRLWRILSDQLQEWIKGGHGAALIERVEWNEVFVRHVFVVHAAECYTSLTEQREFDIDMVIP